MGLLKALYAVCIVAVLPAVAVRACLWRPEVHAEGARDGRVGVACGEAEIALATHQGFCQSGIILPQCVQRGAEDEADDC